MPIPPPLLIFPCVSDTTRSCATSIDATSAFSARTCRVDLDGDTVFDSCIRPCGLYSGASYDSLKYTAVASALCSRHEKSACDLQPQSTSACAAAVPAVRQAASAADLPGILYRMHRGQSADRRALQPKVVVGHSGVPDPGRKLAVAMPDRGLNNVRSNRQQSNECFMMPVRPLNRLFAVRAGLRNTRRSARRHACRGAPVQQLPAAGGCPIDEDASRCWSTATTTPAATSDGCTAATAATPSPAASLRVTFSYLLRPSVAGIKVSCNVSNEPPLTLESQAVEY